MSRSLLWALLMLCAGCATRPPRTIEEARRQAQRNWVRAQHR